MSIRDHLLSHHVWFEFLLHAPEPNASRFAQSLHVPGRLVAKGVLLKSAGRDILAVLPSTARIDFVRLSEIVVAHDLRLATEDEVEQVFRDCERGALPPFGRLYGLTTVVDASLSGSAEIVFVANCRHEGVRMRYRDYEALEAPVRARFASSTAVRQRRSTQRRAG